MTELILVADDDPFNLRLLQELCEAAGYRVITAADGRQVLDIVARERPSLVLLDVGMPVMDGFEVLKVLRADTDLATIPIVLVTAAGDVEAREQGIRLGADDYVTKPYRVFEIQQRIRNALKLRAAEDVAAARERLRSADLIDPLTRVGTSQQLLISLNYEFTRAQRYGHSLTCAIARLGNYRQLLAGNGQDAAEGLLVQLAGGLRRCIRGIDHLFRSDLNEFALLLPETDAKGALVVAERIADQASDESLWGARVEPAPVIQLGSASFPEADTKSGDALLKLALSDLRSRN